MRKLKMLTLGAVLFGVASGANAGALLSVEYSQVLQGVPVVIGSTTATGTLTGSTFQMDAGNWFATAFCIGSPGNVACAPNNGPAPFAPPVTRLVINFTNNGPLTGTTMDGTITAPSGIMGLVLVKAKIGKAPAFTLLPIAVNAGAGGTLITPPTTVTSATLRVFLFGDVWHLGAVTQTAQTNMFLALSDVMATGNVSVDGSGNTHVNLVSLGRVKIRGLANSETSSPTYLKLVFAPDVVPEPGTLMLLGAGVAGLALIGRRKMR